MSLTMTVMDLMKSDKSLVEKAEIMKEKFGCPGKKHPCIKSYSQGKKICEGCWINFFNVQVNITEERKQANETS